MRLNALALLAAGAALAVVASRPGRSEEKKLDGVAAIDTAAHAKAVKKAIESGRAALARRQQPDGHWGHDYPIAITGMAGLALLAANEAPLEDPILLKAYAWMKAKQKDGRWPNEHYTWVHSQGFATLFMAELYGRALLAKSPPKEIVLDELKTTVSQAVTLLADAQSRSGGWNYTKSEGDEGSTTVCAVQALRAAKNFGIPVEPKVLERGFAYLKAMQNKDGGFRYAGQAGGSMCSGSAAAVATLVLMQKLDEKVLLDALDFLEHRTLDGLVGGGHGQYGVFYAAMAMTVIAEEYGDQLPIAGRWTQAIERHLVAHQGTANLAGTWASSDADSGGYDYGTALSVLSLAAPSGRLSVFHRRAPKLPGRP